MRGAVFIRRACGDMVRERLMKETGLLPIRSRRASHHETAQLHQMVANARGRIRTAKFLARFAEHG